MDIEHFCLVEVCECGVRGMLLEGKRLREDNEKKDNLQLELRDGGRFNFI